MAPREVHDSMRSMGYKGFMDGPLSERHFRHDFVSQLPTEAYSFVAPTPVKAPRLVGWSHDLAQNFGLMKPSETGPDIDFLSGNLVPSGIQPYSARYGGHQFGHWARQLGDGRVIGLGELSDLRGRLWEFQLKGAGRTPYSRGADGRAVLRSSIREFICSEAMSKLGIPTTRALSVTLTGDQVMRDMFYDGRPKLEPGAVVCRVAPTFIRFGNFEYFTWREDTKTLRALTDFVIRRHFPELGEPGPEAYLQWYQEICRRTAFLVAQWMRVGFVHGVMNTDNMSILGLTIDYGPYGWLDDYDPVWTPNTTDLPGRRYCYGRQPAVAQWNLARLAEALEPLVPESKEWEAGLEIFEASYRDAFLNVMAAKVGLSRVDNDDDIQWLMEMDALLREAETDMTLFFRALAEAESFPLHALYKDDMDGDLKKRWENWFARYRARKESDELSPEVRRAKMNATNPIYVPRNSLLQQVIDEAEAGNFTPVEELLSVFENPYVALPGREKYAEKRPEWARHKPGCSTLSCSS